METRDVYCPYCHRKIAVVPVGDTGVIFPKCQECKFDEPLDLRFFRRMKAVSQPAVTKKLQRIRKKLYSLM